MIRLQSIALAAALGLFVVAPLAAQADDTPAAQTVAKNHGKKKGKKHGKKKHAEPAPESAPAAEPSAPGGM